MGKLQGYANPHLLYRKHITLKQTAFEAHLQKQSCAGKAPLGSW